MNTFFGLIFVGFVFISLLSTAHMQRNAYGDEITIGRRLFVALFMAALGTALAVLIFLFVGSAQAEESHLCLHESVVELGGCEIPSNLTFIPMAAGAYFAPHEVCFERHSLAVDDCPE